MSNKTYKLIKSFPLSPPVGSIYTEMLHAYKVDGFGVIEKAVVENNPEYWEEIKEWEVLDISTTLFLTNSYFGNINKYTTTINSVKRLSDNTIFSIGDKVINPKLKSNSTFTITKFELDCEGEHMLALGGGGAIGIHKIEKYKEPLFITEDGVEIFKGDGYWQVTPEFKHYFIGNNDYTRRNCDKHFSTEKAAKDCIDLNKPQYSLQDILNAKLFGDDINNPKFAIDINKLKK